MTLDPKSTLRFKGKDGNLYWFESTTGYCYLHENSSGEEDRTFLCKTVDVIKSIWSAEKLPSDCCVGLPGGNHLHPSVTYDDLRYLEIFHGVQLRCLLGDPSLYQDYGVYLCRVYFPDRQEVVMGDIHTILERSKERFLDYSQRGILHACAPRSNQCAFDRRSTWDLQVIRSNPVFLYVFLIFSHFLLLVPQVVFDNGFDEEMADYCYVCDWKFIGQKLQDALGMLLCKAIAAFLVLLHVYFKIH